MQVAVNGIEVAAQRHGGRDDVTPLVLLHGFTGNASDWSGVVGPLSVHRTVWTIEHRGHGSSTNTGDAATYRFDQLVDDLAATVDALGLDRFDLLGHSMGGVVAQRYAVRKPHRLRSLVLMDTGGRPSPEGPSTDIMRGGIEMARAQGSMAVFDPISPFLGEGPAADAGRERLCHSFEHLDAVAFVALGEELLTYRSVLDDLAALDLATTVLVGELDTGLREASDELAATIPDAVLVVIPDAGHSPQVERPELWLAAVEAHLARRP